MHGLTNSNTFNCMCINMKVHIYKTIQLNMIFFVFYFLSKSKRVYVHNTGLFGNLYTWFRPQYWPFRSSLHFCVATSNTRFKIRWAGSIGVQNPYFLIIFYFKQFLSCKRLSNSKYSKCIQTGIIYRYCSDITTLWGLKNRDLLLMSWR